MITKINEFRKYKMTINEGWNSNPDFDKFYELLVPPSDACDTIEGELIRAMSKLAYRYFNDGDYFYSGYGVQTAGSPFIYMCKSKVDGLKAVLYGAIGKRNEAYEAELQKAIDLITEYVKSKNGQYEKNMDDMLNYYQDAKNQFGSQNDDFDNDDDDDDDEY